MPTLDLQMETLENIEAPEMSGGKIALLAVGGFLAGVAVGAAIAGGVILLT
jgi:hypothetical protein